MVQYECDSRAEDRVLEAVKKKVCNRAFLTAMPNPRGYALHMPMVQYECDNLMESHASNIVEVLTLGEDVAPYCWESEICGDMDEPAFDLAEEDDNDEEDFDDFNKEL